MKADNRTRLVEEVKATHRGQDRMNLDFADECDTTPVQLKSGECKNSTHGGIFDNPIVNTGGESK